jgi:hypothetical protein
MSQQDNPKMCNQQTPVEDLAVNQEQAAEVKGGPASQTFFAYSPTFNGGVQVAAGDLD